MSTKTHEPEPLLWRIRLGRAFDAALLPGFGAGVLLGSFIGPERYEPRAESSPTLMSILGDPRVRLGTLVVGCLLGLLALALFAPWVTRQPAIRLDATGITAWTDFRLVWMPWDDIESIGPSGDFLVIYDVLRVHTRDGRSIRLYEEYFGEERFAELPKTISAYLHTLGHSHIAVTD